MARFRAAFIVAAFILFGLLQGINAGFSALLESDPIMEIAPRSCSRSSAAIVDGRIRLSANARSSGTAELR